MLRWKDSKGASVGSINKQVEPLTTEDEEILCEKNFYPEAHHEWIVFCLHSGSEQLRHSPLPNSRILERDPTLKIYPGGLNQKQKVILQHSNIDNPTSVSIICSTETSVCTLTRIVTKSVESHLAIAHLPVLPHRKVQIASSAYIWLTHTYMLLRTYHCIGKFMWPAMYVSGYDYIV